MVPHAPSPHSHGDSECHRQTLRRSRHCIQLAKSQRQLDPTRFGWNRADLAALDDGVCYAFQREALHLGTYRPFTKQHVVFDRRLNDMVYRLHRTFPTAAHENLGMYNVGTGSAVPFSVLMIDALPDLHVTGAGSGGQFFPRWTYAKRDGSDLFADEATDGYTRVDNITGTALEEYQARYGEQVTKDDIFYYV